MWGWSVSSQSRTEAGLWKMRSRVGSEEKEGTRTLCREDGGDSMNGSEAGTSVRSLQSHRSHPSRGDGLRRGGEGHCGGSFIGVFNFLGCVHPCPLLWADNIKKRLGTKTVWSKLSHNPAVGTIPGCHRAGVTECLCFRGFRAPRMCWGTRSRLPRAVYIYTLTLRCSSNSALLWLREKL